MRLRLGLFLLASMSAASIAWADTPSYAPSYGAPVATQNTAPNPAANAAGGATSGSFQALSSQDFLRRIGNALVVHYCDPSSPLLSDFHLTVAQCQSKMTAVQTQCTEDIQPKAPAMVSDSTTAGQLGQALGQCMGQTFVQSQQANAAPQAAPTTSVSAGPTTPVSSNY